MPLPAPLLHVALAVLNGFSQIFLQTHAGCGLLVMLAIAIGAPSLLPGALLGALTGTLSALRLGYSKTDIAIGLYGYNGTLLGLLIPLLLGASPLALLLVAGAAAASTPLQAQLLYCMRTRQWLPGFTLPFILFGWLSLALAGELQPVIDARLPDSPITVSAWDVVCVLLRGIGQVVFLEHAGAGLCLLLALLLADVRAALWALVGSAGGLAIAWSLGWPQQETLAGMAGFNPALAAIALSQVHRSLLVPLLGVPLALAMQQALALLGLPPLTLPFILACWIVALSRGVLQRNAQRDAR